MSKKRRQLLLVFFDDLFGCAVIVTFLAKLEVPVVWNQLMMKVLVGLPWPMPDSGFVLPDF